MPATCSKSSASDQSARPGRAGFAEAYAFLSRVLPNLPQHSADTGLMLHVVRHFLSLGLVSPAVELLDALPELAATTRAGGLETAALKRLPSGRVSWSRFRTNFQQNLAVLAARGLDVAPIEETWRAARRGYEAYQCGDGNFQLAVCNGQAGAQWIFGVKDHRAEELGAEIPIDPQDLLPAPLLVEGLGLGWFLPRLLAETSKVFLNYSPAIYVVEPNLDAWAAVLHLHDWSAWLGESRLHLYWGPQASEQLQEALQADQELPLPSHTIRLPRWGAPITPSTHDALEAVAQGRIAEGMKLYDEVARGYAERDLAYWARRYAEACERGGLRVLFSVSRHTTYLQYCIRDLATAFERQGAQTRLVIETSDHTKVSPITYLGAIHDFDPDMIFIIDHFRHEYAGAIPANVPFVGWVQDLLPNLQNRQVGAAFGPLDFYIAPSPHVMAAEYGYPLEQGVTWTMATDVRTFSNAPMAPAELARYRCDVSYVSNQSQMPEDFHAELKALAPDVAGLERLMVRLLDELRDALEARPATACAALEHRLGRAAEALDMAPLPDEVRHWVTNLYLYPLAERLFRQKTLEWVADYCDRTGRTLHLYGNGWEKHPRFAQYARGAAKNGPELRAIYQGSTINLQIIATGALHQRLLDGLAAGGFFLIRYTPGDVKHESIKRLLEAFRTCRPEYGRLYDVRDMPELARATEAEWRLLGIDDKPDRCGVSKAVIDHYQEHEAAGFQKTAGAAFADYPAVSFSTADEFARLADDFLLDHARRAEISRRMRSVVVDRYSYDSLVDRVLRFAQEHFSQAGGAPRVSRPCRT